MDLELVLAPRVLQGEAVHRRSVTRRPAKLRPAPPVPTATVQAARLGPVLWHPMTAGLLLWAGHQTPAPPLVPGVTCTCRASHQSHRIWSQSLQGDPGAPGEQSSSDHTVVRVPGAQRGWAQSQGVFRRRNRGTLHSVSRVRATSFWTRFPEIHVRPDTHPNQHHFPSTICIPDGKESACSAGDLGSTPGSGKIPWRRAWQVTPVFLPGEPHGQRSLAGYSPQRRKELDTTEGLTHTHTHTQRC